MALARTKLLLGSALRSILRGAIAVALPFNQVNSLPAEFIAPSVAAAPAITGTSYYVSAAGNDANPGTQAQPWATLAKVAAIMDTLQPGDAVLFRGGDTFNTPNAGLWPTVSGNQANPITYGSYGSGKATLKAFGFAAGSDAILSAYEVSGYVFRDLIFDGNSLAYACSNGGATTGQRSDHWYINCEYKNATQQGLMLGADATGAVGLANVVVSGCSFHNNGQSGFISYGTGTGTGYAGRTTRQITNLAMDNCQAYSNGKSGIVGGGLGNSTIKWCVAYSNGATIDAGGGIWIYDASSTTITFCESYSNATSGTTDGFGIDIDGGSYQCGVEFCYSHGNQGQGIAVIAYSTSGGSVSDCYVRNNVVTNNATKAGNAYGDIHVQALGTSTITNLYVHNNTIIRNATNTSAGGLKRESGGGAFTNVRFANNVVHAEGTSKLVYLNATGGTTLSNNLYSGNQSWYDGVARASLTAWQGAREASALGENLTFTTTPPTIGSYSADTLDDLFGSPGGSLARTGGATAAAIGFTAPTYDAFGNAWANGVIGAGRKLGA